MRLFSTARLVAGLLVASVFITGAMAADNMKIDHNKIVALSEAGVFGQFNTYKINSNYYQLSQAERDEAVKEVEALVKKHSDSIRVDAYLTRGFESESDFLFRVNGYDPSAVQEFLIAFKATTIGRYSDITFAINGITKGLNHTTKEKAPELLDALKSTKYSEKPPRYAFVLPITKNAVWWNKTENEKLALMKDHTIPTLPFLVNINRKLYHSTGIDDADWITYFETNDLKAFNDLNIKLFSVSENLHNVRYGKPTIMGQIMPVADVFKALSK